MTSFARFADYFRAVAALGAENDARRCEAIAKLFGLEKSAENLATPPPEKPPAQAPPKLDLEAHPVSKASVSARLESEPKRSRRRPRNLQFNVKLLPSARRRAPRWLEHVTPLDPPRSTVLKPLPTAPLFEGRWWRAVLITAISTTDATSAIDMDAILEAISRGLPVRRIPRIVVPTLSHGVQVLVDRGPSSAPFASDQESLVEQIRSVAGRDRVEVLRFDPSLGFRAGNGPRTRWNDYFKVSRPLPQVAIVLLSDLGIASVPHEPAATPEQWEEFVLRIRARGNSLIAFVPFGPSRWPDRMQRRVGMIPWDRRTSAQSVRRRVGRHPHKETVE